MKKTWAKIGYSATAYIALPAPRGLSWGGAAPAFVGAGFALKYCCKDFRHDILHLEAFLKFRIRLWIRLGRKF